jgi:hypothetical protein
MWRLGRVLGLAVALHLVRAAAPPGALAGEAPPRPRWSVSTNPARIAILHFQVDVERTVGGRLGLFVAPILFHHATWYPFAHHRDHTASGGGVDLGLRYYPGGDGPARLSLGPMLSVYRGQVTTNGTTSLEGEVISLGVQAGYSWLIGRWLLAAGGGLSYGLATDEAPADSPKAAQLPHRGPWINFRMNVGLTF